MMKNASHCAWSGCGEEGRFRAPKNKQSVGSNRAEDYLYFCEEHIKEYNRAWDYFSGMSEEDIIAFQKDAMHGHRPTWERERIFEYSPGREDAVKRAFTAFQGFSMRKPKPPAPERTPKEREALAVLNLEETATPRDIKSRYKALVKELHPDVNNGNKASEERFKRVTQAYQAVKHLR